MALVALLVTLVLGAQALLGGQSPLGVGGAPMPTTDVNVDTEIGEEQASNVADQGPVASYQGSSAIPDDERRESGAVPVTEPPAPPREVTSDEHGGEQELTGRAARDGAAQPVSERSPTIAPPPDATTTTMTTTMIPTTTTTTLADADVVTFTVIVEEDLRRRLGDPDNLLVCNDPFTALVGRCADVGPSTILAFVAGADGTRTLTIWLQEGRTSNHRLVTWVGRVSAGDAIVLDASLADQL